MFINIDKDSIKFCDGIYNNKTTKDKSLIINDFTKTNLNVTKKKNKGENILDYDNFLQELYSLPKEVKVKKTVIKKQKNKVKNLSVKKGIYSIDSKVDSVRSSFKKKISNNIKNSSLYDLDNFIISSNTSKNICRQNQKLIKIFTPNFKNLEPKFFQSSDIFFSKTIEEKDFLFNDEEVKSG